MGGFLGPARLGSRLRRGRPGEAAAASFPEEDEGPSRSPFPARAGRLACLALPTPTGRTWLHFLCCFQSRAADEADPPSH